MTINSKKALIEKFEQGFKLEINRKFRSYSYYVTNYKDTEIAVSRKVVDTMRLEGLIDSNEDYLPKPTTNGGNK